MTDIFQTMKQMAEGWEAIDGADDAAAEANRHVALEQYVTATVIARPFMTADGQAALAALRRSTLEMPAWVPGQDASYGFAREGQDSIIRYIEDCITLARRGPPMVAKETPQATGQEAETTTQGRK